MILYVQHDVQSEVKKVNNKVKEKREKQKITQEELAAKSGVSRTTISDLENQKDINITNATMKKIAVDGLQSSVMDVFFSN
jgi:transcriptional regulator with XRE-family HTH domain